MRLLAYTDRWLIRQYCTPVHWSAERVTGTAIRYLVAGTLRELDDKLDAAEHTDSA